MCGVGEKGRSSERQTKHCSYGYGTHCVETGWAQSTGFFLAVCCRAIAHMPCQPRDLNLCCCGPTFSFEPIMPPSCKSSEPIQQIRCKLQETEHHDHTTTQLRNHAHTRRTGYFRSAYLHNARHTVSTLRQGSRTHCGVDSKDGNTTNSLRPDPVRRQLAVSRPRIGVKLTPAGPSRPSRGCGRQCSPAAAAPSSARRLPRGQRHRAHSPTRPPRRRVSTSLPPHPSPAIPPWPIWPASCAAARGRQWRGQRGWCRSGGTGS